MATEQGQWVQAKGAEGLAWTFEPLDVSPRVLSRKPDLRDNFKHTGIAIDNAFPRSLASGRALNRPRELRGLGQFIEIDILKAGRLHTFVIDRIGKGVAYFGARNVRDEVTGMVCKDPSELKMRTLRDFEKVMAEIDASLKRTPSHFPSK